MRKERCNREGDGNVVERRQSDWLKEENAQVYNYNDKERQNKLIIKHTHTHTAESR